jgi:Icc-related predicted phosphoesterase
MVKILCVSDLHFDEKKLEQIPEHAKGCDAIITAGDDFDSLVKVKGGLNYEANVLLEELIEKYQPEKKSGEEKDQAIQSLIQEYFIYFLKHAETINQHYKKAGIPVFGTPGNHDPLPALGKLDSIKYLVGNTAEFKGLNIAGLPATGELTAASSNLPVFYKHLSLYNPEEPSESAKKLLEHKGKIDIFVTHKAYLPDLQELDPGYQEGGPMHDFGVDAGAVAVDAKFKPVLNVFGHYHLERPSVIRSKDGNQWFLHIGPNASVTVEYDKEKPVRVKSNYYS